MSDDRRVSEALYVGLCRYIGSPTEVTIRREVKDMEEMIERTYEIRKGLIIMNSGSYREGFRFESSDRDAMFWLIDHKVITEVFQSRIYDSSKHSIILVEDTETTPGFVRLQLLSPAQDKNIASSVASFNDRKYILCSKWRQIMLTYIRSRKSYSRVKIHGPCINAFTEFLESDYALCFHCSYWPRLTNDWRKRCFQHNWPPNHVLDDILKNGFNFVPVGSKILASENELEWRISFSQAEQKLVYSMNHTQFLCYGLLKIFLKEVVNRDKEEPFLCSYFVKTTIFWLIQIGHITWNPHDLLSCFWKCFKYLLHCVHRGVMSNFFIPQNNMFASKLATSQGARKIEYLKEQLIGYYEIGIGCMLQSPTLRTILEPVIYDRHFRIEPCVGHVMCAADIDKCVNIELQQLCFALEDLKRCYVYLLFPFKFLHLSLSEYHIVTLKTCIVEALIETGFLVLNTCVFVQPNCTNRKIYRSDRLIGNLLKLAGRLGNLSHLLYLAMFYYRTYRYREALQVIALVQSRLAKPFVFYNFVDPKIYNDSVAGWSLSKRIRRTRAENVWLCICVCYMEELYLEHVEGLENGIEFLSISPFVLVNMLNVLCYHYSGNRYQSLKSLRSLQTILLNEVNWKHVDIFTRDISWQILGICQHVVGDLHGAIESYQASLRQRPTHRIQRATIYRIAIAVNQFLITQRQ